ncbi:hypothetical protein CARUB_v100231601mg, partial [Capsella rubella]
MTSKEQRRISTMHTILPKASSKMVKT